MKSPYLTPIRHPLPSGRLRILRRRSQHAWYRWPRWLQVVSVAVPILAALYAWAVVVLA